MAPGCGSDLSASCICLRWVFVPNCWAFSCAVFVVECDFMIVWILLVLSFILVLVCWFIYVRFRGGLFFWQVRIGSLRAKPSLQALRAETMVERFTARMHVREKFHVFIDCSGSNRPFAISARQFVLCDVFVVWDGAIGLGKFVWSNVHARGKPFNHGFRAEGL